MNNCSNFTKWQKRNVITFSFPTDYPLLNVDSCSSDLFAQVTNTETRLKGEVEMWNGNAQCPFLDNRKGHAN